MTVLSLFPARVRFVDEKGNLTPEAVRALTKLFERVGGALGPSTTDLSQSDDDDSGLEEFKHEAWKTDDGFAMAPIQQFREYEDPMNPLVKEHPAVEQLLNELAGLREQVAVLQTQINDLQQGVTYDGFS